MNQDYQNEIAVAEEKEESIVAAAEEKEESIVAAEITEEEVPEKKSKAGKVVLGIVLGIVALVLVAVIAVGIFAAVLYNKATAEIELPEKAAASEMTDFGIEAALGLLKDNQIVVDNADMQMLIEKIKPTVEASLEGTPFKLEDLYCLFEGDHGTIYGKVFVSEVPVSGFNVKVNKTVSFSANFTVSFADTSIAAKIQELKCGDLSIPVSLVSGFISKVQLPEGLSIVDDTIFYNVGGLDEMVDGILADMLSEKLGATLGDGSLATMFTDYLVQEVNSGINAEINGAEIAEGELIIGGKVR